MTDEKTEEPGSFEQERFYREVGRKMRSARDKKGFTQEAIASSVGLSRTSLTNIEGGRQKLLLHTFVGIASALESTVSDLLPDQTAVLEEIQKTLPTNLPPDQRDFIARTLITSTSNENRKTAENPASRKSTAPRKQNSRSAS